MIRAPPIAAEDDVPESTHPFDSSMARTSGIGTTNWPPQARIAAICLTISSLKFQGRIST